METKTGSGKGKKMYGGLDIAMSVRVPTGRSLLLEHPHLGTESVMRLDRLPAHHHGKASAPLHGPFSLHFETLKKKIPESAGVILP